MSSIAIEQQQTSISWKQMWSLVGLYASIVIGWIAYQQYQPKLLVQFHFTDFAFLLVCAEGVILSVTPLIAGRLGDRYRFTRGNRMPIISTGISFAAMVFMAVAFTLLGNPGEIFKWVLPFLIIMWLIAMSIFTSPALSTIELFIPIDKLPKAMAILTITANLLYALEPIVVDIIDFLGAQRRIFYPCFQKTTAVRTTQHEPRSCSTHNGQPTFIFLLSVLSSVLRQP
jgi:MFS family permease